MYVKWRLLNAVVALPIRIVRTGGTKGKHVSMHRWVRTWQRLAETYKELLDDETDVCGGYEVRHRSCLVLTHKLAFQSSTFTTSMQKICFSASHQRLRTTLLLTSH